MPRWQGGSIIAAVRLCQEKGWPLWCGRDPTEGGRYLMAVDRQSTAHFLCVVSRVSCLVCSEVQMGNVACSGSGIGGDEMADRDRVSRADGR